MAPLSHFLPLGAATASLLMALHYSRHHFISSSAHLHVFILTQAKREEKQSQQVPTDELPSEHDSQQSHRASRRRRLGLQLPWSLRASARAADETCSRPGSFILRYVINKAAGQRKSGAPPWAERPPFITFPHHRQNDLCDSSQLVGS